MFTGLAEERDVGTIHAKGSAGEGSRDIGAEGMSNRRLILAVVVGASAALAGRAGAQARSFVPTRREEELPKIPKSHMPPAGMCRIWIENVPAAQQPAPTDCPSAIRNRPPNGRVIFSSEEEEKRAKGKEKKEAGEVPKGKEGRPKKPDPEVTGH
jgi:hypothetical protein